MDNAARATNIILDELQLVLLGGAFSFQRFSRALSPVLPPHAALQLLISLRLGHLLLGEDIKLYSGSQRVLIHFLQLSLTFRFRQANLLASSIPNRHLKPYKLSHGLAYSAGTMTTRYFRDLDFVCRRKEAGNAVGRLAAAGFIVGDIDPNNWGLILVPDKPLISEAVREASEMHLIRLTTSLAPNLSELYRSVDAFAPRLNELQFYGMMKGSLVCREFVDLMFQDESLRFEGDEREEHPVRSYLDQICKDAINDVAVGRLGISQVVEIYRSARALRGMEGELPRSYRELGLTGGGELLPHDGPIRGAVQSFVGEKVNLYSTTT